MTSLPPRLALLAIVSFASLSNSPLHAQIGSLTSLQNQGTRPVGTSTAVSGSPTTLLPYGPFTTTDIAVPQTDDGSVSTSWAGTGPEGSSLTLAFLNNSYSGLYVNTNGNLSFGRGIDAFAGTNLTSRIGAPLLAPFFADVDLRGGTTSLPGGNIWYRTTQSATELASITARLSASTLAPQNFNPTFAQIVTWDKVGRYGGSTADNTKVSTFQTVLITDGSRTYSLFLYPENAIWWDNGILPDYAGTFARIGYSAGDGVTGYEVAGSGTINARDLSTTSNTGQPGTFVFDVGGTLAPRVVNGTLTLPAAAGTAAHVLQLSANAAGHTITSTTAAGSILFNQLTFDDPANTVAFTDKVVALANAANAITAGNITFANTTVLVAQAASSLNGGTLTLKDSAKLAIYAEGASTTATALTFNKTSGTGGTLDLRGFNTGIGAVNSTGTTAGIITNSGATASTLTLGGTGSGDFNGTLQNGTSLLHFAKTGTGTQLLSGTNTYTGTTTVSGGTLQFAKTSAFYNGVINATTAAKLTAQTGGTAAFNVGGTGEFTAADVTTLLNHAHVSGGALGLDTTNATAGTFTLANTVSGNLGLTKLGTGTLALSAANTHTGTTTVTSGSLRLGHASALQGSTLDAIGGALTFGTLTTASLGGLSGASSLALTNESAAAVALSIGNNGASTTYTGSLSGSGSLTKIGTGTLTLAGDNSYTGATTISAGTLQLGNGGTAGSIAGNISNNGTLAFNRSDTSTSSNAISGSGALTKLGTGTLALSGANTYVGRTTVSAGALQFASPASFYNGTISPTTAAKLAVSEGAMAAFNAGGTGEFTALHLAMLAVGAAYEPNSFLGVDTTHATGGNFAANLPLSGVFGLQKLGSGTLTLSSTNNYLGNTLVTAGTLHFANASAFYNGTVTPTTAARLTVSAGATASFNLDGFNNDAFNSILAAGNFVTGSTLGVELGSGASRTLASLSGAFALTKSGSGTLFLSGPNTYAGTTTVSSGTLQFGTTASFYNGTIDASTASKLSVASGATAAFNVGGSGEFTDSDLAVLRSAGFLPGSSFGLDTTNAPESAFTYAGSFGGSIGFTKLGAGTLTLSGNHTHTGGTTILEGTLQIGEGNTSGSIAGNVRNEGDLLFNRSDALTFAGAISGSGYLIKDGAGTLTLTGANTHAGTTIVFAGNLQIGNGGTSGSIAGNIANNAALSFNRSDALTYSGAISGTGSLTKLGAGTLTVSGNNTFTGPVTLSAGTLALGSASALGSSGTLSFAGGMLRFSAANTTDYSSRFSTASGQIYRLDTNGQDVTLATGLTSSGGRLTKSGDGTLTLTGASTYSGGTVIDAGTLQVGTGGTTGSITGNITNQGALAFNHSNALTFSAAISGSGTLTQLGAGVLTLTGNNTYTGGTTLAVGTLALGHADALGTTGTLSFTGGTLQFSSANTADYSSRFSTAASQAYKFDTNGQNVTLGSALTSSGGSLTKSGSGTLTLLGDNTYTGGTTINAGTLQIGNGSPSGALPGNIVNNAALIFNRSDSLTYAGVISGTGSLTKLGTSLLTLSGANTYSGNTTISGGTLGFSRTDDYTYNGNIDGSGAFSKSGTGKLTLTGTNTFTGLTTVSAGSLQIGNGSTFGSVASNITNHAALTFNRSDAFTFSGVVSGTGSLTQAGTGTLILTGANTFTGTTTISAGALQIGNGGTSGSVTGNIDNSDALTFNRSDALTFSGVVSGTGSLTQAGTGTLILTGANTYTGTTTGSAGTLQIGDGGTTGSLAGNVTNHAAITFNRSDALTYSGVVSGTGTLTKLGSGTLTLTGANTYTGATILSAGTLQLAGSGRLADTTALSVALGATFDLNGRSGSIGSLSGAGQVTLGTGILSTRLDDSTTFSGSIAGTGSIGKLGSGTLTLTGANTYTGNTYITNGTLQIGGGGTSGSLAGAGIFNDAALVFNRSDDLTYAGVISGTGTLTKTGAGALTLSGANTYTGATTVFEGTLQIGNGGTSGSLANSALAIAAGATVRFDRSTASTFAGSISGTGALVKTGAGNLTFSGAAPSFQGALQVNQGLLILASAGNAIGDNSPVTISSGASLSISGGDENFGSLAGSGTLLLANRTFGVNHTGTVEFSGTLTDTGAVNKGGSGNWILSGTNTYVGSTTLNAGTLTAGSASAFGTGPVRVNAGTLALDGHAIANALDVHGGSLTGLTNYAGTQTLSTTMTYAGTVGGAVIVASGGSLNTTGATFTGATTVQTGGLLRGTGTLASLTLNSGATLAPGNSPGTLNVTGNATWNGGANYVWEVANATGGTGTGYDLVSISGTLTLNATSGNKLTLTLASLLANNSAGDAINFNSGVNSSYTIASASGGIIGFDANAFTINTTGFTNNLNGGSWNLSQVGNNLNLNFAAATAIPEPSTYAAFFGALVLGLTLYRKRGHRARNRSLRVRLNR